MNETLDIIKEIIDVLKKYPLHKSIDFEDEIMVCDLGYKKICYAIENMRLFEITKVTFPNFNTQLNYDQKYYKTLAKLKLTGLDFEIVKSKSDIELSEILQEIKLNQLENGKH